MIARRDGLVVLVASARGAASRATPTRRRPAPRRGRRERARARVEPVGIRSVSVLPGMIDTEGLAGYGADRVEAWTRTSRSGGSGAPRRSGRSSRFSPPPAAPTSPRPRSSSTAASTRGAGRAPPPPGGGPVSAAPAPAAAARRDLRALRPRVGRGRRASSDPVKWATGSRRRGPRRAPPRRAPRQPPRRGILGRPAYRTIAELPAPPSSSSRVPPAALDGAVDEAIAAAPARSSRSPPARRTATRAARRTPRWRRASGGGRVLLGRIALRLDAGEELELAAGDLPSGSIGLVSQSGNLALELGLRPRRRAWVSRASCPSATRPTSRPSTSSATSRPTRRPR